MNVSVRELIWSARARFGARDYYGALLCLEDLVGSARAYADVYHLRGLCLTMLERPDEALEQFGRALDLNPRYVEAHLHRGLVLNQLGRTSEAAEAFQAAQRAEGPPVGGLSAPVAARLANEHARIGEHYAEAGALPEAIREYERAVSLGPMFHDLRLRLARLLIEGGNPLRAREELERILELRPDWIEASVHLGLARYLAGDVAGARLVWQGCLAERPDLERVNAYLAMVERIPT
ncbi:MAG: tetratricopeptide repeat protein [Gemmatimonadales bacterium]